MFLRCIFCVIAGYMLFSLVVVIAQDSQPTEPQKKTRIIYREKSYFDFEDTLIRGDRIGPEGTSVFRKERVPFSSSLNLKRSFMPELKESAKETR